MAIVFIRTLILYLLVLIGVRLMGKRQVSELQTSELVTTILLSNISIMPIQETSIPLFYGIVPLLSLICFEVILSFVCLKSSKTRHLISGRPKAVINNGVINQKLLLDLRLSVDDLMAQLRQQQIFDIRDVELAMLEINGTLSVYQKFNSRNITTQMLNIKDTKENNNEPQFIIISDGTIIEDNLNLCNKNKNWLDLILKSENQSLKNILLMTSDSKDNYVLIPKEIKNS
ncbi:MAG: DUF421 domain-containing protein [Oscillospiraceae bacterium]|nr:DUF421 domain-containing protein [Oscillospiraceae bacterium]